METQIRSACSAPVDELTATGTILIIVQRFVAVALVGFTVFALRSRVDRWNSSRHRRRRVDGSDQFDTRLVAATAWVP